MRTKLTTARFRKYLSTAAATFSPFVFAYCAAPLQTHAQQALITIDGAASNETSSGSVSGLSVLSITGGVANTYSATELDYAASLYYDPYTAGFLFDNGAEVNGNTAASPGTRPAALVLSAPVHAWHDYQIETDHYVIAWFAEHGRYRDPYGFSSGNHCDETGDVTWDATGAAVLLTDTYIYLGGTLADQTYVPLDQLASIPLSDMDLVPYIRGNRPTFTVDAPPQQPSTGIQVKKAACTSQRVPPHLIYRHFLKWVLDLNTKTSASESADPYAFARPFADRIGLDHSHVDTIRNEASYLDKELVAQDARAATIVAKFRAIGKDALQKELPLPVAPAELMELQQERDTLIRSHVSILRASLGPNAAARLDAYLSGEFATHISLRGIATPHAQTPPSAK